MAEAATFLREIMGFPLAADEVAASEARTPFQFFLLCVRILLGSRNQPQVVVERG